MPRQSNEHVKISMRIIENWNKIMKKENLRKLRKEKIEKINKNDE